MMSDFSERFRALKEESGALLKDLSDDLGISVPNLSYYMRGREPNYDTLCRIADHYGVTVDYLVGRTNQRNYTDELAADKIKEASQNHTVNQARKNEIEQLAIKFYDLLNRLADLEKEDDNLSDIWKSVQLCINAYTLYLTFIEKRFAGELPLDEAQKAMDSFSVLRRNVGKRVGDFVFEVFKSDSASEEIKKRIKIETVFGIKPAKESTGDNDSDT